MICALAIVLFRQILSMECLSLATSYVITRLTVPRTRLLIDATSIQSQFVYFLIYFQIGSIISASPRVFHGTHFSVIGAILSGCGGAGMFICMKIMIYHREDRLEDVNMETLMGSLGYGFIIAVICLPLLSQYMSPFSVTSYVLLSAEPVYETITTLLGMKWQMYH
ncbi:uncharacterized protein C8R40DRAFT_1133545 [Lentinula edodes]|uniref:uncharacterized protein n=1 Tax=Lentinula edodes TaxID=5353 RepID=UPI001E8CBB39|nr:uncharacterized protein C8R40DRAFT_1133545 [Lentinula edodes]KAH7868684.1 hypothetical protein C8R40DRAFT_1133545 [Lentinula edodes]